MNLHTAAAIRTAAAFDYEGAYDRAQEEVLAELLLGHSVKCGEFTASLEDFAYVLSCRHDFAEIEAARISGKLTAAQYEVWKYRALEQYASDMAVDLADDMLAEAIGWAEYEEGDR